MYHYPPLKKGILLRRYKRFFVDIETDAGTITAHNPNTGSMRSLLNDGHDPVGHEVLYSVSDNLARKLPYTLELICVNGEWIISNTIRVNAIVETAMKGGALPSLYRGGVLRREYAYQDSKIDFMLDGTTLAEVKSVTYFDGDTSYFPDAVTVRGRKHLLTLADAAKNGYRAVMLYVCMADKPAFACAGHIDPDYCASLKEAIRQGVEVLPVRCRYSPSENSAKVFTDGALSFIC